jgi:putative ATP-binding cassette transporter
VEGALTFFINYYTSLANFKSVLDRLTSFDEAIENANARPAPPPLRVASANITLDDVKLGLPDGRRIVSVEHLAFAPKETVLLSGPSGSGKSTLFRAIAGIWPFRDGRVSIPDGAHVMLLPQRPYIPMSSLASAISYPAEPDAYTRAEVEAALDAARLSAFKTRLDEETGWGQRLSGGEQQRVAIARALLAKPDWLFLDEATSALDESLEAEIYRMLAERLPGTTIISIGHRKTLEAFHKRHLVMEPMPDGLFTPSEKVLA